MLALVKYIIYGSLGAVLTREMVTEMA